MSPNPKLYAAVFKLRRQTYGQQAVREMLEIAYLDGLNARKQLEDSDDCVDDEIIPPHADPLRISMPWR